MGNEINPGYCPDNRPQSGGEWERYNSQWWLTPSGDMCAMGTYEIGADHLATPSWLMHLGEKSWFDANKFIPAWFEACRRAGIDEVTMWTHY